MCKHTRSGGMFACGCAGGAQLTNTRLNQAHVTQEMPVRCAADDMHREASLHD